jgi:hypothetical protein
MGGYVALAGLGPARFRVRRADPRNLRRPEEILGEFRIVVQMTPG